MRSLVSSSHVLWKARSQTCPEVLGVELNKGDVFSLNGDWRGVEIANVRGTLWVTQEYDPDDHLVAPGGRFTITRAGRVVMQTIPS